jgi:hypothetical protein
MHHGRSSGDRRTSRCHDLQRAPPPAEPKRTRTWAWIAAGGSALALGGGALALASAAFFVLQF